MSRSSNTRKLQETSTTGTHNDVEAVDQVFGPNKVDIKQKTLEALRLLRQADHALDKIHKYLADCTEYVWTHRSTNTSGSAKVKLEMSSGELTRKQDGCLSQLSSSYIWVRRALWAVSTVLRMCVQWTRYVSTIVYARWWLVCMLLLRHNRGYFVKCQNILLPNPMDGLKYEERQLEDIWRWVCWSQVYGHNCGRTHYIALP